MEGLPIRMSVVVSGFDAISAESSLWEKDQYLHSHKEKVYEYMRVNLLSIWGVL